ncbi:hypothetical protein [Cereibacter ovatus]|nr:hypothetical protein [Cereibacter ovatus]
MAQTVHAAGDEMQGMKLMVTILAGGLALTAPGFAQTFAPPEGCSAFLTVQSRGCRVSHHYRCEQDRPGEQWRSDFDQEGLFFSSKIDAEAQWIESYEMFPPVKQMLEPNPADPASFSDLLGGADSFDFALSRDNGERTRVTGFDRLTGQTVTIDGIALKQTRFEFTERDASGTVLRRAHGNEYIHPDWRLFFAGPSRWDAGDGNELAIDGSPVSFVFPGEPGFLATEPIFDCDAILSQAPAIHRLERASHVR